MALPILARFGRESTAAGRRKCEKWCSCLFACSHGPRLQDVDRGEPGHHQPHAATLKDLMVIGHDTGSSRPSGIVTSPAPRPQRMSGRTHRGFSHTLRKSDSGTPLQRSLGPSPRLIWRARILSAVSAFHSRSYSGEAGWHRAEISRLFAILVNKPPCMERRCQVNYPRTVPRAARRWDQGHHESASGVCRIPERTE